MSQSNDSGLNLDHLEALAKAMLNAPTATKAEVASREFYEAANPAAVLELIALARRATLANQPAPTDWQAAHADMVKRNALLRERPDLPADRIPAHAELVRLQEENARLSANQPAPTVPADTRAAFEAHYRRLISAGNLASISFDRTPAGNYDHRYTGAYWHGWQAATAHQPAQEQAGKVTILTECEMFGSAEVEQDARDQIDAQQAAAPGSLELLQYFVRSAYKVDTAVNRRGYNWSEAYLDQALAAYHANPVEFDRIKTTAPGTPVQMILHCPACGVQHIDAPDERTEAWDNPPHRSHLCHGCGHIWRPADVATEGVVAIQTQGSKDSPAPAPSAPGTPEAPKQPAHGHRDDYYLLANGRRLGLEPISRVRTMPNWVLAMELFATGSTSAHQICRDAGIDPYSTTIQRAAQLDGGQEGSESNG